MRLAVMQPYFFPYIGYFHLINAVDKFVFYDDVNFIKRGWINRNRILINGEAAYFTVQLKKASQNLLINEIKIADNRKKLKKTIELSYKKAPYFDDAWPVVEYCLNYKTELISELAMVSVTETCKYLDISTGFEVSSEKYGDSKGMDKAERLIYIARKNNSETYINSIGGMELYSKDFFKEKGVELKFIKSGDVIYRQNTVDFVPHLSVIDVMMWNDKETVKNLLNNYSLI